MMRVYAHSPSVQPGEDLRLHVEPGHRFAVAFCRYRLSPEAEPMAAPEFSDACGVEQKGDVFQSPQRPWVASPDRDWEWPWISFRLAPSHWPSGVYAAMVYEVDELGVPIDELGRSASRGGSLAYMDSNAALFVVVPQQPTASIAYIVPIATFHAYNFTGGGCFYEYRNPHAPPSRTVTLRRPGCGIGGISREAPDPYDAGSPRQAFEHWDGKMLAWLCRGGVAVDCFTDLDLDKRNILVDESAGKPLYRLMASAGHHEYWSDPMRSRVQGLLDAGGNVAIFSGNTCYRKISFDDAGTSITKENECWPNSNEAGLLGVSYSHGGGWWGDRDGSGWKRTERPPIGYTVAAPDHWVFEGVQLPADGVFGAPERLLGYECDGVTPQVSPPNTIVLAQARLQGGWNNGEGHTAAMVIFDSGRGSVFNAATTDWARILGNPTTESYAAVSGITHNVVGRLSAEAADN
jgi:hypothetical protein